MILKYSEDKVNLNKPKNIYLELKEKLTMKFNLENKKMYRKSADEILNPKSYKFISI